MKYLNLEIENNVGIVTFKNPPHNCVGADPYNEFKMMFDKINVMKEIRVVILKSEGKHFCSGNDISEIGYLDPVTIESYLNLVKSGIGAVYTCKVPVIAVVQGGAIGAGLAIAACCDLIVASDDAIFGIPEIKVGIVGAAEFADLIVPRKVVNYMALTGKPVTAKEVYQYGGVHKLVPRDELLTTALKVTEELLANGPLILRFFKEALQKNLDAKLIEKYNVEGAYTTKYIESKDFQETISAFFDKRKPQFEGK